MSEIEDEVEALPPSEEDFFEDVDVVGLRRRLESFIPQLVRRGFTAGMAAMLTTEEGIRKVTEQVPMPKEVAGYLASTAATTKDEIMRIFAREIREFLQSVNLSEEIAKMLTTLSFEVKTEIRFIPNDQKLGGVSPDVKAKVALKKSDKRMRRKRRRPPSFITCCWQCQCRRLAPPAVRAPGCLRSESSHRGRPCVFAPIRR
jgi:hypothetical protein